MLLEQSGRCGGGSGLGEMEVCTACVRSSTYNKV